MPVLGKQLEPSRQIPSERTELNVLPHGRTH
jgi:hypothetical protein